MSQLELLIQSEFGYLAIIHNIKSDELYVNSKIQLTRKVKEKDDIIAIN